jgi:hypothetical protein
MIVAVGAQVTAGPPAPSVACFMGYKVPRPNSEVLVLVALINLVLQFNVHPPR